MIPRLVTNPTLKSRGHLKEGKTGETLWGGMSSVREERETDSHTGEPTWERQIPITFDFQHKRGQTS